MGRSTSPLAKFVATATAAYAISQQQAANAPQETSQSEKARVDKKANDLAGGPGSGLGPSPLSGSYVNSAIGDFDAETSIGRPVTENFGAVNGIVQNKPETGDLSTFTEAVGKIPGGAEIVGGIQQIAGGDLAGGIQTTAGGIATAAGSLNNILSLKRGSNIPAGGELFQSTGEPVEVKANPKNDWRVRLNCQWNQFNSSLFTRLADTGGVVWPLVPTVQVSTTANYNSVDPVHSNYPFLGYKSSQVDDITISGEFPVEVETDAEYWIAATTFLKTATKMFYGVSNNAGNPPIICQLSGYGSSIFNNVPVVVTNFQVSLNEDVNYIKYNPTNTWVPVLSTIQVTVKPIYSRSKQRQFSLQDYARGTMTTGASGSGQGFI